MNILKNKKDREQEKVIAILKDIEKEANQREYNLDIKPFITANAEVFSRATNQDSTSVNAVYEIIKEMEGHFDVEIRRVDNILEIWKNGHLVDHFPLDRKLSERDVQKMNIEGSFIYGRPGTDIFSIIPPEHQF